MHPVNEPIMDNDDCLPDPGPGDDGASYTVPDEVKK